MDGPFKTCMEEEIILDYLLGNLSCELSSEIEKHFALCPQCSEKARTMNEAISALSCLKARNLNTKALKNLYWDAVALPAAGSNKNSGISEARSVNGKFLLRLIPFIDESKSILEIRVLDENIHGVLTIENENGIIFRAELFHGIAAEEVDNPIDLRNVIIKIENM